MHGVGNAPSPTRGGTVTPLFVVLFVLSAPLFLHPFPSTLAPPSSASFSNPFPKMSVVKTSFQEEGRRGREASRWTGETELCPRVETPKCCMASWAQMLGAYPLTVLLGTRTKKKAIGETRASDGFARCKREEGGEGVRGRKLATCL